ncbi:MAG: histidine kinase, partial [Thermoplasmata archaeon]
MEEGTPRMAKVLIVDDNMKNIQVLGSVLRDAGYSVSFSTNGEDALRKMEGSEFDIILLDIMM